MAVYTMTAFPKTITLHSGLNIAIRPLVPDDKDALLNFFLRVPEQDRFYLKEDVTSPKVIAEWTDHLNYSRALPILAFDGDLIVADGTLHHRRAGSMRHLAKIRVVVDPDYRKKGVGTALIRELIEIAKDSDFERLIFELVSAEQEPAIRTAEALGFVKLATVTNYVRDVQGKPHDLLIMELPLGKWQEWWEF